MQPRVLGVRRLRLEAHAGAVGAASAARRIVGAAAVPGEADEERPVGAIVRRPPLLGVGENDAEILFHCSEIDLRKLRRVVEVCAVGARLKVCTQWTAQLASMTKLKDLHLPSCKS